MDLIKQQEELQKEARRLLGETGLLKFLSHFGEIEIGGSLDSGLMTWPDIDLGVFPEELSEVDYWKMVKFAFGLEGYYHSLYIQDFRKSVNPNSPKGLYIGLKIKYSEKMWKVDIWYVKPRVKDESNFNKWLKKELNDVNKKAILEIKSQVQNNPKYRKDIFSVDVYKAVIEDNAKDVEDFKKYLAKTNRSL